VAEDSPFANFVPSTEVTEPPKNAGKKTRKKKSAKSPAEPATPKVAAMAPTAPTKTPKKTRKPREKKARAMKVDLTTALVAVAGLTEQDCQVLEHLTSFLASHPKKSRSRVIVALGKIFA
jgi:hypothetical protein